LHTKTHEDTASFIKLRREYARTEEEEQTATKIFFGASDFLALESRLEKILLSAKRNGSVIF
jgi:hypothetical protein